MTQSNSGNAGAGGRATGFQEGQLLPSLFGIKGKEDLGGGLTTGFELEGGFDPSNGSQDYNNKFNGALFGRNAKVTIGGDWGTFAAGLQMDPALIASASTEPRGLADAFSMLGFWVAATQMNGSTTAGLNPQTAVQGGLFDNNAVSYTYANNGVYLGTLYGFGGVAGSTSANAVESIGASYANSGFTVSGSYVVAKNGNPAIGGNSSEIGVFGLGYVAGNFAVRGQFAEFKDAASNAFSSAITNDVKCWGIGLDWKTSVPNLVNIAYYNAKDDGPNLGGSATAVALLDKYYLSKRTQIFAQIARVKTDANSGNAWALDYLYTPAAIGAGASTVFLGAGIQHEF